MKPILYSIVVIFSFALSNAAEARKSSGYSSKSYTSKPTVSSSGYGTGSKVSNTSVRGYTKQNGTSVAPSHRSTPDSSKTNNWSTKPNMNPYTGKTGTRVTQ